MRGFGGAYDRKFKWKARSSADGSPHFTQNLPPPEDLLLSPHTLVRSPLLAGEAVNAASVTLPLYQPNAKSATPCAQTDRQTICIPQGGDEGVEVFFRWISRRAPGLSNATAQILVDNIYTRHTSFNLFPSYCFPWHPEKRRPIQRCSYRASDILCTWLPPQQRSQKSYELLILYLRFATLTSKYY